MPRPRQAPAPSEAPDLRHRILDTARALLDEHGTAGLSLREVARRAGVTHQAPYHHFADRESILAELVMQGFEELARRLAAAHDGGGSPHATMRASGLAYVGFALDQPGVFRIMFRPDVCDPARYPHVLEAGERAYGELLRLVQIVHGAAGHEGLAAMHWAQVHGLAVLLLDGPLGLRLPGRAERDAFLQAAAAQFATTVLGPDPDQPSAR